MPVFFLSLPMQGEHDKLVFSKHELERTLSEMTAHTEELKMQHDEETKKYRLIEVPSSHTPCMSLSLTAYFPCMYVCMYVRSATMYETL